MPTDTHHKDVVFFGSGAFGLPTMAQLAQTRRVVAVVTQPDRPAGRGKKLTPNPIAAWAAEHLPEAELIKHERVDDADATAHIRSLPAQDWVIIAFGQKLGPALLADRFAINLHASLLPRWRGAAPIHHAIVAGDEITGNSVITLAQRMDAGLVLGQQTTEIGRTETTGALHDRLAALGPELVLEVLAKQQAGKLEPVEQDESLVTLAGKLGRQDAELDWSRPADQLRAQINGLSPWPGCAAMLGTTRLKLLRADSESVLDDNLPEPGTLADPTRGLVVTGAGALRLLDVQPAGSSAMPWADFCQGHQPSAGVRFKPV